MEKGGLELYYFLESVGAALPEKEEYVDWFIQFLKDKGMLDSAVESAMDGSDNDNVQLQYRAVFVTDEDEELEAVYADDIDVAVELAGSAAEEYGYDHGAVRIERFFEDEEEKEWQYVGEEEYYG